MAAKQRFLGAAILFVCALGLALVPNGPLRSRPKARTRHSPQPKNPCPHFMHKLRRASFLQL